MKKLILISLFALFSVSSFSQNYFTKKFWNRLTADTIIVNNWFIFKSDTIFFDTYTNGRSLQIKNVADPTDLQDALTLNYFNNNIGSFTDDVFQVANVIDETKIFKVDVSGVTAGTTRTLIIPDADGIIALGSGSSTDNTIPRWDGTTGFQLQNSNVKIDDSDNLSSVNSMELTAITAPVYDPGIVFYDFDDDELSFYDSDFNTKLNIGSEMRVKVRNNSGSDIVDFTPVYQTGAIGNRTTIDLAKADSEATSRVIAVTTSLIVNNTNSSATTSGTINGVDTDGSPYGETWVAKDEIFLSATTAGWLTNVAPTGNNITASIGHVLTAANNGSFEVKIDGANVRGASSSTDNAMVRMDGNSGKRIQETGIIIDDSDNMTGMGTGHDIFTDYIGNEHIDHISITLTAGDGLSGGGDISANRSFAVNVDDATIEINSDILRVKVDGINDTHVDWGLGANQVNTADLPIALGGGSPTVDQMQQYIDNIGSSGFFLGGTLSDGGAGTLDVAAGSGFIRTTNDPNAELQSFKWSASAGIAVTDNTTQYVYVDDSGVISLSTDEFLEASDKIQIGVATKESGAVEHVFSLGVRLEESIGQAGRFIRRVHGITRDKRMGGLIFGQSGDANRDVTMTTGMLWWGRTEYDISAFNTSGADVFETYSASGQESAVASQWPNTQYDNVGTLTTMANNRWANLFFFILPDDHTIMVYGRSQFTSQALAENEDVPSSSLPSKITETGILATRFTFQESSNTAIISSAFEELFANAGVTDHGNLAGLADDDHAQYWANTSVGVRSDDYSTTGSITANSLDINSNASISSAGLGTFTNNLTITGAIDDIKLNLFNTTAPNGENWYLDSFSDGKLYFGNDGGNYLNFSSTGDGTFTNPLVFGQGTLNGQGALRIDLLGGGEDIDGLTLSYNGTDINTNTSLSNVAYLDQTNLFLQKQEISEDTRSKLFIGHNGTGSSYGFNTFIGFNIDKNNGVISNYGAGRGGALISSDAASSGTLVLETYSSALASEGSLTLINNTATFTGTATYAQGTLGSHGALRSDLLDGDEDADFLSATVVDEAYGSGWDGDLTVPTKNAIYDKIETLNFVASWDGDVNDGITVNLPVGGDALSVSRTKIVSNISIVITDTSDSYLGGAKWVAYYTYNGGTPQVNYSTIYDSTPTNITWDPLLVSNTAMVRLVNNTGATVEYMATFNYNK